MKLIVYYSYSGSCKVAAEYLQEKLGGEVLFLAEEKPFKKSIMGCIQGIISTMFNKKTALAVNIADKVAASDLIYLISPIWGGKTPPAINAFLAEADLEGKKVNVLTVQGDEKLAGSEKVFLSIKDRIENKGGTVDEAQSIQGGGYNEPITKEQAAERILFK
ncbi:MAG: flavodoxin family protein [Christensenellales bacterium]|jgi:flavodoxin